MVAKLSGCPIVVSSRRDMGFNQSAKHRIAYRLLRPLFNQVQTVSNEVRESCIRKEGLAPDRVVTLYNGVDLQAVAAADGVADLRHSLGLESASHIISTVGNIRWIKGTDIAVQVAAKVCARHPRAVFLIPGKVLEQEYYDTLEQTVRSLGLIDNVKFLGSSDRVFSLLKISDVFCLLSRSEGFSNALLEAMAAGLPCVATDVGGNKEAMEDAQSGFLVPNEDVNAAAEKILALLDDPALARRMGRRGREIIEQKFTTDVMVNRLASFYDALLQRAH
jgi:glycosyltransferase involved in cell wall biosynthesis